MIRNHLDTWAMKGVHGHFDSLDDSSLPSWTQADDVAAEAMAPIVGALPSEVAVMGTLTANLHLLMCSFYLPTKERPKIIMESKAFPSDHVSLRYVIRLFVHESRPQMLIWDFLQFAVESQIRMHNLDPADAMILLEPKGPLNPLLTTEQILSVIDTHASTTALLLLPGIQYYTGQLFDIPMITAYAKAKGIVVGWDLAHAAGNVELKLHDWDVDFAAWCNYKYLNSGPGAIAGLFVHEKHGQVDRSKGDKGYRPRLSGWWGGDKSVRFQMDNSMSSPLCLNPPC
jgi:kynureninase